MTSLFLSIAHFLLFQFCFIKIFHNRIDRLLSTFLLLIQLLIYFQSKMTFSSSHTHAREPLHCFASNESKIKLKKKNFHQSDKQHQIKFQSTGRDSKQKWENKICQHRQNIKPTEKLAMKNKSPLHTVKQTGPDSPQSGLAK